MVKSEFFRIWWFVLIIKMFGVFFVKCGKSDIGVIKKVIEVIKFGNILGIFLEGKRNRIKEIILKGEKGVVIIIKVIGVKVLLVGIFGKIVFFGRIRVRIGRLMEFRDNSLDN